ncbi:hypothetical protein I2A86_002776 [Staphylococcus aureus]|nr:hypothetical protein [Staphylococcus aureus]
MTKEELLHRPYGKRRGEVFKFVFLDGKAITGVLLATYKYELIIQTKEGKEVTIFKHALKYLTLN